MTTTEIKEKIAYLEDDNIVCRNIIKNPKTPLVEKGECRQRILANDKELMKLKTLDILIEADPLF